MIDFKVDNSSGEPLYKQIENQIRRALMDGTLSPGEQLPTEMELMEKLGVSIWTVREGLSALVHEGLLVRRPRKGTFVAPMVRKRANSHDVGVIVFDFYVAMNYEQSATMRGISKAALERGYNVHLFSVSGRILELGDPGSSLNELILNEQNAGLLVVSYIGEKALSVFDSAGIPYVTVDVDYPDIDCVKVLPDDVTKLEMAFRWLYSTGRRRIALLAGKRADLGSKARRRGDKIIETYLSFAEKVGMVVDSRLVKVSLDETAHVFEEAKSLAREIFSVDPPPDAIVCQSNAMTYAAIEVLDAKGLRIPEDVAVVGHATGGQRDERIWTTEIAFDQLGEVGMNLLADMIEGRRVSEGPLFLPMTVYPPKGF